MRTALVGLLLAFGFLPSYCSTGSADASQGAGAVPVYTYQIVRSYPHDRGAFTQGLIFRDGVFYEGSPLSLIHI